MISHRVEIPITGGGADEKDEEMEGSEGFLYRFHRCCTFRRQCALGDVQAGNST